MAEPESEIVDMSQPIPDSSPAPAPAHSRQAPPRGPWALAAERFLRHRLAMACSVVFGCIVIACFIGPLISAHDPNEQNLENVGQPPSMTHWMGTDSTGRDVLTRVLVGGRLSLAIGVVATLVAVVIGTTFGAIAGYLGGRFDAFMMRFVDVLYAFPLIIFVILLTMIFQNLEPMQQLILLFCAIGAVEWPTTARIVRGQVLGLKNQEYVLAARSVGVRGGTLLFRHILPNVMGPVIVYATLTAPAVMLFEAVLSFLGLGVQPPQSSWGVLINDGANSMEGYPWLLFGPVLFFSATLFSLNAIGDGLRDALDPRGKR